MIRIDICCTKQNSENGSTEQGRFLDAFGTLSRPLQKGVGRFREQRTLSRPKCRNSGEGRFLDAFGTLSRPLQKFLGSYKVWTLSGR